MQDLSLFHCFSFGWEEKNLNQALTQKVPLFTQDQSVILSVSLRRFLLDVVLMTHRDVSCHSTTARWTESPQQVQIAQSSNMQPAPRLVLRSQPSNYKYINQMEPPIRLPGAIRRCENRQKQLIVCHRYSLCGCSSTRQVHPQSKRLRVGLEGVPVTSISRISISSLRQRSHPSRRHPTPFFSPSEHYFVVQQAPIAVRAFTRSI